MVETNGESGGACRVAWWKEKEKINKTGGWITHTHTQRWLRQTGRKRSQPRSRHGPLSERCIRNCRPRGRRCFCRLPLLLLPPPSVRVYLARFISRPEFFRPPPFFPLAFLSPPTCLIALFTPLVPPPLPPLRFTNAWIDTLKKKRERGDGVKDVETRIDFFLFFFFLFQLVNNFCFEFFWFEWILLSRELFSRMVEFFESGLFVNRFDYVKEGVVLLDLIMVDDTWISCE